MSVEGHDPPLAEAPPTAPEGRLAARAGASLAGTLVATAGGALSGVFVSRLLGPAGKGTASVALVVVAAAAVLVTAGFDLWISAELGRGGWPGASRRAVRSQLVVTLALGAAAGLVACLVTAPEQRAMIAAVVAATVATSWMALAIAVAVGLRATRAHGVGQASYGVLTAGSAAALLLLGRDSVALVIASAAGARLAGAGLIAAMTSRRRRRGAAAVQPLDVRGVLRFGVPASVGSALTLGIYRLDVVLVAALASSRDAGLYSVAAASIELLAVLPDAMGAVLLTHVARHRTFQETALMVRTASLVVLAGGVAVAALSPWLVPLIFGTDFASATEAIWPLALAGVALCVWKLVVADLAGRGDSLVRIHSMAVGIVIMLGMDALLVPRLGILGAGLGCVLGYGAAALVAVRRWSQQGGRPTALVRLAPADAHLLLAALRRSSARPSARGA